ncbi:MAG: ATP-dependent DNA helicase RecG [Kiritimatiellia bacterium]|jgi:ATP-dependent DNA helicase RecG
MPEPTFDPTPFLVQDEGQHFERKSLFAGPDSNKRVRDRRDVRDQIAKVVASFANAEGGVLILGLEDDGKLTGHRYPPDAIAAMLAVPRARLLPAQPEGFVVDHAGVSLLVFDVPAADSPVQVTGDGFPLRIGDQTVQASESQIRAFKVQAFAGSWESRPSPLHLDGLEPALLERARQGSGHIAWTDEEYLLKRKLADLRGRNLVLRHAAELVFAKHGPDHPNAGVRIFRVIGTERRFGPEHNVEERPRIEGPLPLVIDEAIATIGGLLRRPSRMVGNRFREVPEYPEFSWKEALINAIAHRDYSVEGGTTEVWLFEDRMEVTSPGGLFADVRLDDLIAQERVHRSRNPRLMRVLVDLGAVRDQGEGIPRMFAEMEGLFLPAPSIEAPRHSFKVVLRNTPTLSTEDRSFVSSLGAEDLSDHEFRALLDAHRHGRVDNARMRQVAGLDTLSASRVLGRLRDRGLLALHSAGPASYYTLGSSLSTVGTDRPGSIESDRPGSNADRPGIPLPPVLQHAIDGLGARPRKARLWPVIEALCAHRAMGPADLARVLGFRDPRLLVRRHLKPLVDDGRLERTRPDSPSHPKQAYRTPQEADIE